MNSILRHSFTSPYSKKYASDGLIQPELDAKFKLLDFAKAPELFEIGYREGIKWVKEYKKETQEISS